MGERLHPQYTAARDGGEVQTSGQKQAEETQSGPGARPYGVPQGHVGGVIDCHGENGPGSQEKPEPSCFNPMHKMCATFAKTTSRLPAAPG